MSGLLAEVAAELARAERAWPDHRVIPHGTGGWWWRSLARLAKRSHDRAVRRGTVTKAHVLIEEVLELLAERDPGRVRAEAVQVAAVSAGWIKMIDGGQAG